MFDLLGRRVAVLTAREFEPGRHQFLWDGRDLRGHPVRPGVYLYRLLGDGFREQRTMVVLP